MNYKDWQLTFSTKLLQRLSELGMTQSEFSRLIGASPAMVNHWCLSRRYPIPGTLIKIEKLLSLPSGWFMYWEDDLSSKSTKVIKCANSKAQELPLLNMASIPEWLSGKKLPDTGTYRMMIMEKKLSYKAFIAIVEGDAMVSSSDQKLSLSPGDEIIADPKLEPFPGCLVIISVHDNDIKIRQYQQDGKDIILKAFDSKYPNITKDENVNILAVIFEKRISLYPKK